MKVVDPGHVYQLTNLDGKQMFNVLVFVKREGEGYPGNVGHHPGTNIQEVMRALIHRLQYLDQQIPDYRNQSIIRNLRDGLFDLEARAAERHGRREQFLKTVDEKYDPNIEDITFCQACGHICCGGTCGEE